MYICNFKKFLNIEFKLLHKLYSRPMEILDNNSKFKSKLIDNQPNNPIRPSQSLPNIITWN